MKKTYLIKDQGKGLVENLTPDKLFDIANGSTNGGNTSELLQNWSSATDTLSLKDKDDNIIADTVINKFTNVEIIGKEDEDVSGLKLSKYKSTDEITYQLSSPISIDKATINISGSIINIVSIDNKIYILTNTNLGCIDIDGNILFDVPLSEYGISSIDTNIADRLFLFTDNNYLYITHSTINGQSYITQLTTLKIDKTNGNLDNGVIDEIETANNYRFKIKVKNGFIYYRLVNKIYRRSLSDFNNIADSYIISEYYNTWQNAYSTFDIEGDYLYLLTLEVPNNAAPQPIILRINLTTKATNVVYRYTSGNMNSQSYISGFLMTSKYFYATNNNDFDIITRLNRETLELVDIPDMGFNSPINQITHIDSSIVYTNSGGQYSLFIYNELDNTVRRYFTGNTYISDDGNRLFYLTTNQYPVGYLDKEAATPSVTDNYLSVDSNGDVVVKETKTYIPYSGADKNVDLNNKELNNLKQISFNLQTTISPQPNMLVPKTDGSGLLWYDDDSVPHEIGGSCFVEVTKTELDALISSSSLKKGFTYKVSGVNLNLYGGTTIYVTALDFDRISTDGYGVFYNPKYDNSIDGFGIAKDYAFWATLESQLDSGIYDVNDTVIWGGKQWTCIQATTTSTKYIVDSFNLNTNYFTAVPFNDTDYNVVVDKIKYDYEHDLIVERNEQNSNVVSFDYFFISDNGISQNPIRNFQWGNVFNGTTLKGVGNQRIINSLNENINFQGKEQFQISLDNGSIQRGMVFLGSSAQRKITLTNGGYQIYSVFSGNSGQDTLTLNNSHQKSLRFTNGWQINLIFNESYQDGVSLNSSRQESCTFEGSRQMNISLTNNSYQRYLVFNRESGQYDITLNNNGYQAYLTFNRYSDQSNVVLNTSSQVYIEFNNSTQSNLKLTNSTQINMQLINMRLNYSNILYTNKNFRNIFFKGKIDFGALNGNVLQDINGATVMFDVDIIKEVYVKPNNTLKLKYFNNSDVLTIADITD